MSRGKIVSISPQAFGEGLPDNRYPALSGKVVLLDRSDWEENGLRITALRATALIARTAFGDFEEKDASRIRVAPKGPIWRATLSIDNEGKPEAEKPHLSRVRTGGLDVEHHLDDDPVLGAIEFVDEAAPRDSLTISTNQIDSVLETLRIGARYRGGIAVHAVTVIEAAMQKLS